MNKKQLRWFFLIVISIIWGSSFILMKKALIEMSPLQVGALRIVFTAITLMLISFKPIFTVSREEWFHISITALIGTFFPVFLFAYAVFEIDSSIVSILNSLTPLNTLIVGALYYSFTFFKKQIIGIIIGLMGSFLLIYIGADINPENNYSYALLIFIASIGYAFNVNIIKKHLNHLNALTLTTCNMILLVVPALLVLWLTDFFHLKQIQDASNSIGYVIILSIFGTALAKTLFNRLVQISSPIFSSSVTYLIPLVAIFWGVLDNEKIQLSQVFAGGLILFGVYLTNNSKRNKSIY